MGHEPHQLVCPPPGSFVGFRESDLSFSWCVGFAAKFQRWRSAKPRHSRYGVFIYIGVVDLGSM